MTTTSIFKRLLMASATTLLIFAMGNVPANAVQYKISGIFASEAFTKSDDDYNLENGFFDGVIDFGDLRQPGQWGISSYNYEPTPQWKINFFQANGLPNGGTTSEIPPSRMSKTISTSSQNGQSSILIEQEYRDWVNSSLLYTQSFKLFFDQPDYTGNITNQSYFYTWQIPYRGLSFLSSSYEINLTGYSEKLPQTIIPEPKFIFGLGVLAVAGLCLKKRQLQKV
ncbi:MAG TPA: hypothetical protein VK184_11595 [Nostocaceae cyanobacterium]|nr:hypothetical protein [Nostocaceae cyanobacterium]